MMHDWVLRSITYLWSKKCVEVEFEDDKGAKRELVFMDVRKLLVTQDEAWGESVCINDVKIKDSGPGMTETTIEIQSGDSIEITSALRKRDMEEFVRR